ncbi:SPRY domain-containing SOCS box protein 3, partial [Ctenopharyngodon idella]|uniref:SPRY domain-containing SOCS box protein 3 n=1 Tax=Ctenopharyngodon idella TaxID=7959 RepID=UPI00222F103F
MSWNKYAVSENDPETEATPINTPLETEATPLTTPLETEATPINMPLETEATPINMPLETEATPINMPLETEATPLTTPLETEATPLRPEDKQAVAAQSEADSTGYEAVTVCVPAEMPPVVPVTGESFCQCPAQTELSSDVQICPYIHSCTCGEEEQGCDWVWDDEGKSFSVSLSCSNRKVSFHSEYSCGTAAIRGAKALSDGQHFWEIKMTSPVYGTDMMVGIGTSEVNLDQFKHSFCSLLGTDEDSWGLSYTGQLHHKGSKVNFSSRFGQGSIIGVHLDSWHGTLSFYKNRRCIDQQIAAAPGQAAHFEDRL